MPQQVQIKNGPSLTISDNPFASGGEGDLFKILGPADFVQLVVKIYKKEKQTTERERKIEFLTTNIPSNHTINGHHSVVWANKLIYQSGRFAGFTMPLAQGVKLEMLCHAKLPKDLGPEWRKFDFSEPKANELRQKICFNIAVALHDVHVSGQYVLVDFKPENVMIQPNGLISIIDTDSVQVTRNKQLIYAAPVVTPEFTPPEYYRGIKPETVGAPATWDMFCLGVIFYRLLCGLHPYVGTCEHPFDHCTSYELKIENGLFPNGRSRSKFKVIPKEHDNFKRLGERLRKLFLRCFDDGHSSGNLRPTIEEWCQELAPGIAIPNIRKLPSAVHLFPTNVYSKEIVFKTKANVALPEFPFPALPKKTWVASFMSRLGIVSEHDNKRQAINFAKDNLKELGDGKQLLEKELQFLIDEYDKKQTAILQKEQQQVDKLKQDFSAEMGLLDNSVKNLITIESKENQALYTQSSIAIGSLQNQISVLQNSLVDEKNKEYASQTLKYKALVVDLQDKKVKGLITITNPPNKLAKYVIGKHANEIFGSPLPNIILNMRVTGFVTAEDFIDIGSNGELKRPNGAWIKVSGLGTTRALRLKIWRRDIERQEDLLLNSSSTASSFIKQYDSQIQDAHKRYADYAKRWHMQIRLQKQQFEEKKTEIELQINSLNLSHKSKLDELKARFDNQGQEIEIKAKAVAAAYSTKVMGLNKDVHFELIEAHTEYSKQLAINRAQVQDFITLYTSEGNKIFGLYKEAGIT